MNHTKISFKKYIYDIVIMIYIYLRAISLITLEQDFCFKRNLYKVIKKTHYNICKMWYNLIQPKDVY